MSRTPPLLLTLATVGLVVALVVGAPAPGVVERVYSAVAGLLVIVMIVRRLEIGPATERTGRPFSSRHQPDEEPLEPADAAWLDLERGLRLGALTAGDFDHLIRPRLAALAGSGRRRSPAGSKPDDAGSGDLGQLDLLMDGNARLRERSGPGIPLSEVEAIVSALEARSTTPEDG